MTSTDELRDDEWADWYRMTPLERWNASLQLFESYLLLGGTLDPGPDTQSPFHAEVVAVPPFE